VQPRFDHFIFIEKRNVWCQALEEIRRSNPDVNIKVIPGDANEVLRELVSRPPWTQKDAGAARGVVFLDPYALHVEWDTLKALASTRVLDVWYLFPIGATIRQLAHNFKGIGPREATLDRLLGPEWRELYSIDPESVRTTDLFEERQEPALRRVVSVKQFENWLKGRLQKQFAFVSDPLPLLTSRSRQLFSLFLCVSNPSKAAINLAEKFVGHVNKNFGPRASRRRFGL
jgi:three-Cys-motif partner protein